MINETVPKLLTALQSVCPDENADAEAVADWLWLAAHSIPSEEWRQDELSPRKPDSLDPKQVDQSNSGQQPESEATNKTSDSDTLEDSTSQSEGDPELDQSDNLRKSSTPLYSGGQGTGTGSGLPIRVPGGRALPHSLALVRALRPLKRQIETNDSWIIDEEATVRRIADTGIWIPVLKANKQRWLELALVLDESPSMRLWHDTVKELRALLVQLGAFRDIRTWKLKTSGKDQRVDLHAGEGETPCHFRGLVNTARPRLIVIVSDFISPAWQGEELIEWLNVWGREHPVNFMQLLPQRLWRQSRLRTARLLKVTNPASETPNSRFHVHQPALPWAKPVTKKAIPFPLISLESDLLADWAHFIVGNKKIELPAFQLQPRDQENVEPPENQSEENERLQQFRAVASPTAYKLACFLAAAPLMLPVMRLVQRVLVPESGQSHLAEFFLSGLIKRVNTDEEIIDPDKIVYDFLSDTLRNTLLESGLVTDAVRVQEEVSRFINEHYDDAFSFQAIISDPKCTGNVSVSEELRPFAKVTASVLDQLGGDYAKASEQFIEPKKKLYDFPDETVRSVKKILILSANPKDTARLRLDREVREIQDRLKRAKYGRQFTVQVAIAVRIRDLRQELLEHEPDIVHFCGHGDEEGILLEDEQGKAVLVPSEALSSLFALFSNQIQCVLLNACYAQHQAEAIHQYIPYVVGIKKKVTDKNAVEFVADFYTTLGWGKSIEDAFAFSRTAAQLSGLPDHLTPILLQPDDVKMPLVSAKKLYDPDETIRIARKILILLTNPNDTARLRFDQEVREIQNRLKRAKYGRQFTVQLAVVISIRDIMQELLEQEPDIVHFCGPGEEGGILLENEQGKAVSVLSTVFALFSDQVECVLFNACYEHDQAKAIRQHVPYIIGIKREVLDEVAVEFVAGFYSALGFGKSLEDAFAFGSTAVQLHDLPFHLTPILLQSKMALLSVSPLDDEQNWKAYLDGLRKIACPIDHFSLSIDNLNNLEGYDYILILSKVVMNKLLIENEYLCSDKISFQELEDNIGNRQPEGIFIFTDRLPEPEYTAKLSLPTFILPVENKKHIHSILFQLFRKNNLECCDTSRVLHPSAFHLRPLSGKKGIYREETELPKSISSKALKGFVGRKDDLENICRKIIELGQGEVLTVKGEGGIGKTHTVKKLAAALAQRGLFSGGIHFIDCEPVADSGQFRFKAAAVFGLELAEDLWEHLSEHHDEQERLIIFDNFEPLLYLDDQLEIKEILSRIADYATVLVTSREVLELENETAHLMRRLTTGEAVALFKANFPVPEQQMDALQDILPTLLDNNPLAIKLITNTLPKGKNLNILREELENDLFSKFSANELQIFDSDSDNNIERVDSLYYSILFYSYRSLNEQEQAVLELLSLLPDGINLEEFKLLTAKRKKQKKMPPLLITDRLVKALVNKSMIESNSGQLKLQTMIGRLAHVMLKQRQNIAPLYYRNVFAYNRRLANALGQMQTTSEQRRALEIFSSQQKNFLAAIRYCDRFEADREELLEYFVDLLSLFMAICSLDEFIHALFAKINLFQGKERQCAKAILIQAEYFNGDFLRAFGSLQQLVPLERINSLDRSVFSERLQADFASEIYALEGETLWAANYEAQHHFPYSHYPGSLANIGEYSPQLAAVCQDNSSTFEVLAKLGQLTLERIDTYLVGLHEKQHIERIQTSYIRAKLKPLPKEVIEPLVVVNPYTRGLKKLMLAFIKPDADQADLLYQEAAEHLWHIRYYHVEALYCYAVFFWEQEDARFTDIHQRGMELARKHHYRFLQYRFEELVEPSGLAYDSRNYPLPDNQDFSEYINFLIKQNQARKSGKTKKIMQRRR